MSCPICKKKAVAEYRPFCSKRCADVDLSKWFSGEYAVPSQDHEEVVEAIEALEKRSSKLH
ncbi:DNA gyrase inhibitor YacG [Shimia sp. MMG029]|uniref:DNA gyrase inhibitor YacG n=1 Tax=Shimia sp. MMG029 TaxID=3021978 RepID=UPI0022FDFEE2|nr:DNA gyrase inhibitor YacG [Shimia sp. MMG029]MDA5558682.1 DNA gyrase inhibitor YacG [Shimia sp. MMG029]